MLREIRGGLPQEPVAVKEMPFIVKGAGVFLIGTLISSGLKYLFEFLVARRLGPSGFGVFFLGLTVFRLMEKVGPLELNQGLLRFIPIRKKEEETARVGAIISAALRVSIFFSAILSVFVFLFATPIGHGFFHVSSLGLVLKILSLSLIFSVVAEILAFSLQALGAIQYRVYFRLVLEPALGIIIVLFLFQFGPSLWAPSIALTGPFLLSSFLSFWFLKRFLPVQLIRRRAEPEEVKELLAFSWPLFSASLLSFLLYQVTPLMFGYFRSTQEVGLYAAALRTSFLLLLTLEAFNSVFAPLISDLTNRGELKKLEVLFKVITKWVFSLSLPLFLILTLFGREVLGLWGKRYQQAFLCLLILAAGQLINCATGPVGYMISMSGRPKISLANTAATLGLNIFLNLLLIPHYGVIGGAISFALSLSLVNLARLIEVWLILKIHPYRADFYKPLLAGFISFLITLELRKHFFLPGDLLRLVLGTLALGVIYSLFLIGLGIAEEEKIILVKIREKLSLR